MTLTLLLGLACAISGASLFIFFDRYERHFVRRRLITLMGFGFMLLFGGMQMVLSALGWDQRLTAHLGTNAWLASLLVVTLGTCSTIMSHKLKLIRAGRRHF